MVSPAQKLQQLVRDGSIVLSGKAHGGAGRSFATLGGRQYAFTGGPLTKTLETAVLSASLDRGGAIKIQRSFRNRRAKQIRDRNAYVHELVEGLRKINRGEADKVDLDLKRVKTRALKNLIVANVISGKRLALKLPTGAYYFLNDRSLQRLADGLIDKRVSPLGATQSL